MPTNASDVRRDDRELECPACGSEQVLSRLAEQQFDYGDSNNRVRLRASVPMLQCSSCGLEYTDHRAEVLRHEAVCAHLGMLTPRQIYLIRSERGLSRQRFSELTRLGAATLARWESGEIIQNPALDTYLRLISRPEVFALLESGQLSETPPAEMESNDPAERFPTLAAQDAVPRIAERARQFRLAA